MENCIIGSQISNQICDKFSITFKIKSFGLNQSYPTFDIGYATGDSLEDCVKDWNSEFGRHENKKTSWAFSFYGKKTYYIGTPSRVRDKKRTIEYKLGDMIQLVFNFKENQVKAYHNEKAVDGAALNADKLWVGLCFVNQGTIIELVRYRYD